MDDPARETDKRYGLGLTEPEVRRLQEILRREGEPDLTIEQAWARAVELVSVFRMLLGPMPEDRAQNPD